jgi:glycosyltransferase involved in cell wall biosynthesis
LARELGVRQHIDLPGFQRNPFAYMAKAAAFALSSRYEGLPSVLIQALACGVPVVATDCPSGPAEILDGGRYGRLVPVGDSEQLAKALHSTLTAPERYVDEAAWTRYSFDASVDQYQAAIAEVCGR